MLELENSLHGSLRLEIAKGKFYKCGQKCLRGTILRTFDSFLICLTVQINRSCKVGEGLSEISGLRVKRRDKDEPQLPRERRY